MQILKSFKIKSLCFQNRVVMAPMVPFGIAELPSGEMSEELVRHYIDRAENRMGLLILQALSVAPTEIYRDGIGIYHTGIYSENHKNQLKRVVDAFHKTGSRVLVQLGYSGMDFDSGGSINAFSTKQIQDIRNAFILSASLCKEAGCDGIELHGAHGFFLNMMTSEQANQRKDIYGGSFENRLRIIDEIVQGIQTFSDDRFIIGYRMGWTENSNTDIEIARTLEAIGIELLHVSIGIPAVRGTSLPDDFPFNEVVHTGITVKANVQIPVIVVNDIQTLQRAEWLIENGMADFAAFGRPFLADELFLNHSIENAGHRPCFRCRECKWLDHYKNCPAYKMKK